MFPCMQCCREFNAANVQQCHVWCDAAAKHLSHFTNVCLCLLLNRWEGKQGEKSAVFKGCVVEL